MRAPTDAMPAYADAIDDLGEAVRRWPTVLPALVLGVVGTVVQAVGPLRPALATPLSLAFLALICIPGFVATARARRADWWLATLIVVLAMFPNSSVNPDLRIVGGGFRLFTRLVGGGASIWDILMAMFAVFALWMRPRGGTGKRAFGRSTDVFLVGVAVVAAAGIVNGMFHALVINYGPTSVRSVIQAGLPLWYLFAAVVVARLAIVDRSSLARMLWAIRMSTAAVLIQGVLLLFLSIREEFASLRGFLGIPIVLYDQLTILNVFVSLAIARYAAGLKLGRADWVMSVGCVLFLLMSTRRLVLIMLVFDAALIFLLSVERGRFVRTASRMVWGTVVVTILAVAGASIAAPKLIEAVGQAISSINVTSQAGQSDVAGGALRISEVTNMYMNLGTRFSPVWLVGRGVGTYWKEYVPTQLSLDVGSGAFVASQLEEGARGWWPAFHIPFVSVVYRFGIIGFVLIWVFAWAWVIRWRMLIGRLSGMERAFAVTVVVLMVSEILSLGESLDSAGPSFYGLVLAGLAALHLLRDRQGEPAI